jgi:hypothetical protein
MLSLRAKRSNLVEEDPELSSRLPRRRTPRNDNCFDVSLHVFGCVPQAGLSNLRMSPHEKPESGFFFGLRFRDSAVSADHDKASGFGFAGRLESQQIDSGR